MRPLPLQIADKASQSSRPQTRRNEIIFHGDIPRARAPGRDARAAAFRARGPLAGTRVLQHSAREGPWQGRACCIMCLAKKLLAERARRRKFASFASSCRSKRIHSVAPPSQIATQRSVCISERRVRENQRTWPLADMRAILPCDGERTIPDKDAAPPVPSLRASAHTGVAIRSSRPSVCIRRCLTGAQQDEETDCHVASLLAMTAAAGTIDEGRETKNGERRTWGANRSPAKRVRFEVWRQDFAATLRRERTVRPLPLCLPEPAVDGGRGTG